MQNKFLIIQIIVVLNLIFFTIGCIENNSNNEVLTITYEDFSMHYTLQDLETIDSFSGSGRFIKSKLLPDTVVIENSESFTGVRIIKLLDNIPDIPVNYIISIISSDGWNVNFTKNEVQGFVDIYDEKGNILLNQSAVMIVAYQQNGEYYSVIDEDNEIGPLRIAFIGDNVITSSSLWSRNVITIKINNVL
jgi:hypothetical protein